jgi:hypothetical protein
VKKKLNESKKLNLSHFIKAARMIEEGTHAYCCNALSQAGDTKGDGYDGHDWISTPEREFFHDLFWVEGYAGAAFEGLHRYLFGSYGDGNILEIRLLALCFAREAAKDWNRGLTKRVNV